MSSSLLKALVLACVFAAVMLAVEAVLAAVARRRSRGKAVNQRLQMIGQGASRAETMMLLRRTDSSLPANLPPWLVGPARRFERMLMMAGVTTATGKLMLILLLAPIALFALMVVLLGLAGSAIGAGKLMLLMVVAGVVGVALPLLLIQARADRRRKKIQDQFPVALDIFVRGLRAGHPIAAALELLTIEMPDPIGSQFGLVVDEVTYGADLKDALQSMAERWELDDIRMFVVSVSVQAETGGNLAEILENLARVIRERSAMMLKVRALSSEGRMTAVMLSGLPVLAFTILFLVSPAFYLDVADDPAFVPGFGGLVLLYLIGFFTIRRMVDLKV